MVSESLPITVTDGISRRARFRERFSTKSGASPRQTEEAPGSHLGCLRSPAPPVLASRFRRASCGRSLPAAENTSAATSVECRLYQEKRWDAAAPERKRCPSTAADRRVREEFSDSENRPPDRQHKSDHHTCCARRE